MTDTLPEMSDERIDELWRAWDTGRAFARAILSEGTASLRDDRDSWCEQASARTKDAVEWAKSCEMAWAERDALMAENERLRAQVAGMRIALEKGAKSMLVKAAGDAVRRADKAKDKARAERDNFESQVAEWMRAANEIELAAISERDQLATQLRACERERDRLDALVNSPETRDFIAGVRNEVAHQVGRWGTVHDRAKEPADWFWLVGYLGGKALASHVAGNTKKALHHCISTAAVLANWHTHITLGTGEMTPGSSDLQRFLTETFGDEALCSPTPGKE